MPRMTMTPLRRCLRRLVALGHGRRATGDNRPRRFRPAPAGRAGEALDARRSTLDRAGGRAGFTLIELIVVVTIIGILATIAVPAMRTAPIRAREAALKEDLYQMRSCIDQFHADRDRYPESLEELVEMGYLRAIPMDPIARTTEWDEIPAESTEEETEREAEMGGGQGIIDVRSTSEETALDGTKYNEW